jgi:hypothetical protein
MMKRILWLAAGAMLAAPWVAAQESAHADKAKAELAELESLIAHSKMIGPAGMVLSSPVTGAPYAAEEVTMFTQMLSDGTRIQRDDKVSVYRDGQGRVRRESPNEITIMDAAAGVGYVLDPKTMTARKISVSVVRQVRTGVGGEGVATPQDKAELERMIAKKRAEVISEPVSAIIQRRETVSTDPKLRAPTGVAVAQSKAEGGFSGGVFRAGVASGREPVQKIAMAPESLGQQSIEGVMSEGTRGTETIPVGAIGNDRPIQVVNERWYSPDLKTVTMTRRSDPRSGEEIFRLTNVRRGEPSPDLFQLPASYRLVGQ